MAVIITDRGLYNVKCNRITIRKMPTAMGQPDHVLQWLASDLIVEWDAKDASGAPVPITAESIKALGPEFLSKLMGYVLLQLTQLTEQMSDLLNRSGRF